MSNRDTRRSRDHPADMPVVSVPHLHPKGQVRRDVMEVGIGELAQQFIDAEIKLGGRAPKGLCTRCEAALAAERVKRGHRLGRVSGYRNGT